MADPASSRRKRHIARCDACQAELERMRRAGEEFERIVRAETAEAIHRALEE